jgi:hypothetical protein
MKTEAIHSGRGEVQNLPRTLGEKWRRFLLVHIQGESLHTGGSHEGLGKRFEGGEKQEDRK